MGWTAFAAVGLGAALGAWLRWLLGQVMNPWLPNLPLGTLAANLLGGLLMGVALALFAYWQDPAPEWRLFMTTGFLGGLTTFSTFSGEAVTLLERHNYGWFAAHVSANLIGTLAATVIGLALTRCLLRT